MRFRTEPVRTPLRNFEKEMLIKRAKKKGKKIPKFLEDIELDDNLAYKSETDIRTDYHKRLEEIKEKFPKAYEPWGIEEDKKLGKLPKEGNSSEEISKILKSQPGAIRSRLKKLGLLS